MVGGVGSFKGRRGLLAPSQVSEQNTFLELNLNCKLFYHSRKLGEFC